MPSNQTLWKHSIFWTVFISLYFVFIFFPHIDIWASAFFYAKGVGFPLDSVVELQILRKIINYLVGALFVVAVILWVTSFFLHKPNSGIPSRVWGFITTLYILGPIILVNAVAKNLFGRARPAAIVEFGGTRKFTRPFELADQCATNCSFVSGEGAGVVTFYISVVALMSYLPHSNKRLSFFIHGLGLGVMFLGLFLRLAKGRHFLSDTVFAVLFVGAVAICISPVFTVKFKNPMT